MQQTLRLIFRNAEDRLTTISIPDPDPELTGPTVEAVMDTLSAPTLLLLPVEISPARFALKLSPGMLMFSASFKIEAKALASKGAPVYTAAPLLSLKQMNQG